MLRETLLRHRTYAAPLAVVMLLLTGLVTPKPALQMPVTDDHVCEIGTPFRDEPLFPSGLAVYSGPGPGGMGIATGDFNGDSRIDLISSSYGDTNIAVLINQTADNALQPSFSLPVVIPAEGTGNQIRTGDLNNDGRSDAVLFSSNSTQVRIILSINSPDSSSIHFIAPIIIDVGENILSVEIGDINADKKEDIIIGDESYSLKILLNKTQDGASSLSLFEHSIIQDYTQFLIIARINDDNKNDLIVANSERAFLLINTTNIGEFIPSFKQNYQLGNRYYDELIISVAAGDINGDSRTDVILDYERNIFSFMPRSIFLNETSQYSDTPVFSRIRASRDSFRDITNTWVADFDGNDLLDIVWSGGSGVGVSQNQTTNPKIPAFQTYRFLKHGYSASAIIADLNADGLSDIIAIDILSGNIHVKLNATPAGSDEIDFGLAAGLPIEQNALLTTADLNRDGREDIIAAYQNIRIRMNHPAPAENILRTKIDIPTAARISDIATGDINGDGNIDLVASHYYSQTLGIYLNNTPIEAVLPILSDEQILLVNRQVQKLELVDMNGDQRPDLFLSANNGLAIMFNQTPPGSAELQFDTQQTLITSLGQELVIADLNNDTRLDIVRVSSSSEGESGVGILLNTTTEESNTIEFAPQVFFPTNGPAQQASVADLNDDRRLDLITTSYSMPGKHTILINTTPSNTSVPSFQSGYAFLKIFSPGYLPGYPNEYAIKAGDLNNDDKPDLLVFDTSLYLLENEVPSGAIISLFTTQKPVRHPDVISQSTDPKLIDLNNDGHLDIVSPGINSIFVLLNHPEAAVTSTTGTPQHTLSNTSFAQPLEVVVTDSCGNPVEGAQVRFMAPLGGASAFLSSDIVTTDANGRASVLATADGVAGSYHVIASINGTAINTQFALTNDPLQPQETVTPVITPIPTQTPPTQTPQSPSRLYIPITIAP